jgi:hypothetical protein
VKERDEERKEILTEGEGSAPRNAIFKGLDGFKPPENCKKFSFL